MDAPRSNFSLEPLERRICPSSVTPITFDPEGTLVKNIGTVNGVKFIQISPGGGHSSIFGFPGTGSSGSKGVARVFATDLNNNNFIDADEITGVAVSAKIKLDVFGNVNGDIVTNSKGNGDLSGDANDGSDLLTNSITQIHVRGSVFGDIISGQSMSKVTIDGSVNNLIVGTAANGRSFHFHGPNGPATAFSFLTLQRNENGGSIKHVAIETGVDDIFASDAGIGGDGGSIETITITNDTDGVMIRAGTGGDSDDRTGGHGGDISKVEIHSSAGVSLEAGDAGDSTHTNRMGGDGGSITAVKINAIGPVTMTAGDAGTDTQSNSAGGDGGSIEKSVVNGSACTFTAGTGGDGLLQGGEGGQIVSLKGILSGETNFFAGTGGGSSVDAGSGGNVRGLKFLAGTSDSFIRAIAAGNGGDGSLRNGPGGSISSVRFDGDIGDFNSSYGIAGMGGLFAGRAGATVLAFQDDNGSVSKINADRVASIVAGTDLTDSAPKLVRTISGIKASEIGANFDQDVDSIGANEPAFDYFESIAPSDQYNLGEVPIDGPVLGLKVAGLSTDPLFLFVASTHKQSGNLDPHA